MLPVVNKKKTVFIEQRLPISYFKIERFFFVALTIYIVRVVTM